MTKQETYNLVYQGLRGQGFERSTSMGVSGLLCQYRSPCGTRKCAVGHLIPDSEYLKSMEALGGMDGLREYVRHNPGEKVSRPLAKLLADHSWTLLRELQSAHDIGANPMAMKIGLHRVAKKHNLTIPKEA